MAKRKSPSAATKYIDVYILPVPKRNAAKYRNLARRFAKVFLDHGGLEYREFIADDLSAVPGVTAFPKKIRMKRGETLVVAVAGYRSKGHRNRVNAKLSADPRLAKMMEGPQLFESKRMLMGGFKLLLRG